jgi:hypothetical protein
LTEPESGNIVAVAFTPVLAKHSQSFLLIDCMSLEVDRMQRNFESTRKQVETWQTSELTDVTAKVVICEAFVEGKLEAPKHLARAAHSASDALIFDVRFPDNSFPPQGELSLQVQHSYRALIRRTRRRQALAQAYRFLSILQLNDLPSVMVSVAGAGEKRAEPVRGIGALSLVRRRPVLVGLSFGRRDRDSNPVIECSL